MLLGVEVFLLLLFDDVKCVEDLEVNGYSYIFKIQRLNPPWFTSDTWLLLDIAVRDG